MALLIRDPRVARLVNALVELTGESETEAVTNALKERLTRIQRRHGRQNLAMELNEIAVHCAAIPVFDDRSTDEIIGYDEYGLPI